MQFLYLFSFVVAVSYAAALPQPAGLSEKYSNNVDATLASGLEARSYQPGSNSHKDSATLVSAENNLATAPENVKAAGAVLGDSTGKLLVEYAQRSLQVTDILNNWVKDAEKNLFGAIKAGLGNKQYSKVKSLLKDVSEKLAADASYNLQQVTAALSNIENKVDFVKLEVEAVQVEFVHVFEDYKFYIKTLRPHLDKFASGQDTNKYLSDGVESLVEFSLKQEALYFIVREGIPDAIY
ncbi:hypothetical protein BASA50_003927 [Batrachochytrium salamandrivorans]|uniref:Uncharacterized protein n=1 Tax=Batrachochytrium salamandrivorans TaxID=1357716 RepID=A0ABQ8FJJ8_9FUNG|nr:hypothetical protein BASA50_003927 [Batrachochytrium salamandrivorans]